MKITSEKPKERYKLLKHDHIKVKGRTLYRIKALVDINDDVKKGDIGGYIEKKFNLDIYDGESWVYKGSKVYGDVYIAGNTKVIKSKVFNTEDDNYIIRNAYIKKSKVKNSMINCIFGSYCYIYKSDLDNCSINLETESSASGGNRSAVILQSSMKECDIYSANISKSKTIIFSSTIYSMDIPENSCILGNGDIISFCNFGSEFRRTFISLDKRDEMIVECGCFRGSIYEFKDKIDDQLYDGYWDDDSDDGKMSSRCSREYKAIAQVALLHFYKDGDIIKSRCSNKRIVDQIKVLKFGNKVVDLSCYIHDEMSEDELKSLPAPGYDGKSDILNDKEESDNGISGEN